MVGAMAKSKAPVRRRKNILVDQRKLHAAKSAPGALTETAAIDAALDLVVFRAEVFSALDRVATDGGLRRRVAVVGPDDLHGRDECDRGRTATPTRDASAERVS